MLQKYNLSYPDTHSLRPRRAFIIKGVATLLLLVPVCLSASPTVLPQDSHTESRRIPQNAYSESTTDSEQRFVYRKFEPEILLNAQRHSLPIQEFGKRAIRGVQHSVGTHRNIPQPYLGELSPILTWNERLSGEKHAALSIRLPVNQSLRVKLGISTPSNLTIRYSEIDINDIVTTIYERVIPAQSAGVKQSLSVWTPSVQYGALGIEFVLPKLSDASEFSVKLLRYSTHHVASRRNSKSSNAPNFNQCEGSIDAKCADYPGLADKLASVGRILVEKDGEPMFCTGTLLNSRDASDDPLTLGDGLAPYLLTSNNCVSTQDEADSLEITWFYESEFCGDTKFDDRVISTYGGGELLSTSADRGFSLIRLRGNLPSGLVYSGWNASSLAIPITAHSIHHPSGDAKKVSAGTSTQHEAIDGIPDAIRVEWDTGGVEPGSDGAGLFVGNYLVGTLIRSDAFCEQSVSHFSGFASFFPLIRGYLMGDHADEIADATYVHVPISVQETLTPGDIDYFEFEIEEASQVAVHSEGGTNTFGRLIFDGQIIDEDDNDGLDENFLIQRRLEPGSYAIQVTGATARSAGLYRLRVSFSDAMSPTAAPTNIQVTRKVGRLAVSWDELSTEENGGSRITGYRATASNPQENRRHCSTPSNVTQCEIDELSPGLDYAVSVNARNTYGQGPASIAVHAVPLSRDASKLFVSPSNIQASIDHADGSVGVTWDAIPIDAGRAEVVSYTAEATAEASTIKCETTSDITSCVLSGFEDGKTYQLTVYAISAAGDGPRSDAIQITPIHTDDHSNLQTNAKQIGLNSRTASFLQIDDIDYFIFTIDSPGSIHLWSEGDVDTHGRLHTGTSDLITDNDGGQGSNFSIRSVLTSGTYYLRMTERGSTSGNYTLAASFRVDDHGNGRIDATRVEPDSETSGYIAFADEDYFRIDIADRGTIQASTHGDADTYGRLQSESDDLAADRDGGPGSNFNLWRVVNPGSYYVQVFGESGSTGDYLLGISFDRDDHGDSQLQATIVDAGSHSTGYLARGDEDYFRVDIENRGTLHASTHGEVDTHGSLQSETNDLVSDRDGGPGSNFNLWHVVQPGRHYIRVIGELGSTGKYVLGTAFDKDDHGDDQSSATNVNPNSVTEGFLAFGDVDYLRVELIQPGTLSFTSNGNVDVVGQLQSETADLDSDLGSGPGRNFSITADLDSGVYFLRISAYPLPVRGSYRVITSFETQM